jgi:hypothetical protein
MRANGIGFPAHFFIEAFMSTLSAFDSSKMQRT